MKKILGVMLMAMLVFPAGIMAMSHGEHDKKMDMDHGSMEKMDHGKMEKMDHSKMDHGSGMAMGGDKIMLQDVEVEGVMASGHMLDTKEKMAEHGMALTHHIMVSFMDAEGASINDGKVAVKIESPDGKVSKPIMMMGMSGAFGADINLDKMGMYKFQVGTKLADGKKRTFNMHYDNK
jgi:hypothetical protein